MSCPTRHRRVNNTSPPRNNRPQLLTAQDFRYKSFLMRGLRRIPAISMKTRNFGGRGYPTTPNSIPGGCLRWLRRQAYRMGAMIGCRFSAIDTRVDTIEASFQLWKGPSLTTYQRRPRVSVK